MGAMFLRQTRGVSRSAAFFDLDRTILPGGSGPVFAEALERLGLKTPKVPGQSLFFRAYELVGESLVVMQLAKQAVRRAVGLDRAEVLAAAEDAADTLHGQVQPYVASLLEEHRAKGDVLVLATTSPYDLVAPLARRLGFEHVVATRYGENEGLYTGDIDGEFVWGRGKLRAVRAFADEHEIDLAASSAYSDSVFDFPLLAGVGHPVAVNPDMRLRTLATLRRWPIRHLDVPAGVPKFGGIEPADVLRWIARPELFPYVRFEFSGLEHLPATGPAIVACNHRSYFDPVVISLALGKVGRNARMLGKKEVFDAPVVGSMARALGGIRVDRGTGSAAPLDAAAAALRAGEVIVILPQGTIPRGEEFFEPELTGRSGVARLAAMVPDVPVIPMALWGTEAVWPRSSKVPHVWNVADPPMVNVVAGSPVKGLRRAGTKAKPADPKGDTAKVMSAIVALLPDELRQRRTPTEAELAKTRPA